MLSKDRLHLRGWWFPLAALTLFASAIAYAQNSEALAINNAGVIVGWSTTATSSATQAVTWPTGATKPAALPMPSGWTNSEATAINNASPAQAAGYATNPYSYQHAVEWSGGTMIDLGTLKGGTSSAALGINKSGVVVGWSTVSTGYTHAVEWVNGAITDLGKSRDPNSEVLGINDGGRMVGWYGPSRSNVRAAIWENGQLYDLNSLIPADSGWLLRLAVTINEHGQIFGFGVLNGPPSAFLLTPN